MIQIAENLYINKNQILYIDKDAENGCFEIVMAAGIGKYIVSEYSSYYYNIVDLLESDK